jgi:hypothetical protein
MEAVEVDMTTEGDGVSRIDRRKARSGNVSYSDPVVVHESRRSRVVVVPFFIEHTTHTELAIKLITYRKANPPTSWFPVEEKSISLQEQPARILLKVLGNTLR